MRLRFSRLLKRCFFVSWLLAVIGYFGRDNNKFKFTFVIAFSRLYAPFLQFKVYIFSLFLWFNIFNLHTNVRHLHSPHLRKKNTSHYTPYLTINYRRAARVDNQDQSRSRTSEIKFFAFYFPQFHPIYENDAESMSFTEWDLIRNAPDENVYGFKVQKPENNSYPDYRRARRVDNLRSIMGWLSCWCLMWQLWQLMGAKVV